MADPDTLISLKISNPRHQLFMQSYISIPGTLPEVGLRDNSHHFFDCLCFAYPEAQIDCNGFPTKTTQVDVLFNRLQNLPQVTHSHSGYYRLLLETHFSKTVNKHRSLEQELKQYIMNYIRTIHK